MLSACSASASACSSWAAATTTPVTRPRRPRVPSAVPSDCEQLVDQTVEARARVLEQLGDARRTDTERIDEALSAFGGDGPDLAVRYEGLGCDQSFDDAVCAAMPDLAPAGPGEPGPGRDVDGELCLRNHASVPLFAR